MPFKGVCRAGDIVEGTCNNHNNPRSFRGTWRNTFNNVTANGLSIIRKNDIGDTDCGHTFRADAGSVDVDANDLPLQRVGDTVTIIEPAGGAGISITGSSDVISN